MFTGIVKGLGRVASVARRKGGARLTVQAPPGFGRFAAGESVSVSGVCLTAIAQGRRFAADLSGETLRRSTLGALRAGDAVNLERALAWGDRLSGHFVMGHVDGVSRLLSVEAAKNSWTYRFSIPAGLSRFVVEKGSVALDGVSLTVASRRAREFEVAVIPKTRSVTTLGGARAGALFNFEADVFARYGAPGWRRRVGRARKSS
jgi:riboflavin synthase